MTLMLTVIEQLIRRDDGQDLLEYGLLAALVAITVLAAVGTLGNTIKSMWWEPIADAL